MKFNVTLTSYINGQHRYTEPYDSGTTEDIFSAEIYAAWFDPDDLPVPTENETLEFTVNIWDTGADPMFDDPIYCSDWRYSHEE